MTKTLKCLLIIKTLAITAIVVIKAYEQINKLS